MTARTEKVKEMIRKGSTLVCKSSADFSAINSSSEIRKDMAVMSDKIEMEK